MQSPLPSHARTLHSLRDSFTNKNKSPLLQDAGLTDAERADLVAFLGALECGGKLEEPKLP